VKTRVDYAGKKGLMSKFRRRGFKKNSPSGGNNRHDRLKGNGGVRQKKGKRDNNNEEEEEKIGLHTFTLIRETDEILFLNPFSLGRIRDGLCYERKGRGG